MAQSPGTSLKLKSGLTKYWRGGGDSRPALLAGVSAGAAALGKGLAVSRRVY